MNNIFIIFLLFILYSMTGWIVEIIDVRIIDKKWINRGFLIGPYCPIYGVSALIMAFYLSRYKDNIITVFLLSCIVCSIIEYFTSYIMEKLFNTRWWDYSDRKFNFEGRICLRNSFLFGLLGVLLVYLYNPLLLKLLLNDDQKIIMIISIIMMIIFIIDFNLSLNIINKFKSSFDKDVKDITEDINNKFREKLKVNKKTLQKRIIDAYPKLKPISNKKKN